MFGGEIWATLFFMTAFYAWLQRDECNGLKFRNHNLHNTRREQEKEIQKLKDEIVKYKSSNKELKEQYDAMQTDLQNKLKDFNWENKALSDRISELEKINSKQKEMLSILEIDFNESLSHIAKFRQDKENEQINHEKTFKELSYQKDKYEKDIQALKTKYNSEIRQLKTTINDMQALIDVRQTLINTPFLEWAYQNPDKLTYAEREVVLLIQSDKFMSWVKQQPDDKVNQIRRQMRGLFSDVKTLADEYKDDLKQEDDNFNKLQELLANSSDDIMDWVATLPQERQDEIMEWAESGDDDMLNEVLDEYYCYLDSDNYDCDDEEYDDESAEVSHNKAQLPFSIKEYTTQAINPNDFRDFDAKQMVEVVKKSCFDYLCLKDENITYSDYDHFHYYNDVFGDFDEEDLCLEFGRLIHECVNWIMYYNGYSVDMEVKYFAYSQEYNHILKSLLGDYGGDDLANGLQRYIESFIDYCFDW